LLRDAARDCPTHSFLDDFDCFILFPHASPWGNNFSLAIPVMSAADHYSEVHKEQLSKGLKEETVLFFEDVAKLM
jgi:hypothetical protein